MKLIQNVDININYNCYIHTNKTKINTNLDYVIRVKVSFCYDNIFCHIIETIHMKMV